MKALQCVVDCAVVRDNLLSYRRPVILMAKARCYGLGLEVAEAVEPYVVGYGVAFGEEGVELRRRTHKPILVTTPWWDVVEVVRYSLTPMVQSVADAERLRAVDSPVSVHLKLNTGMNRFGISTPREMVAVLGVLGTNPYIRVAGAYTHYASAANYAEQNRRLSPMLSLLPRGIAVHTQATSTASRAGFDLLRVGMGAYAHSVRLYSRVLAVRRLARDECAGYDGVYTATEACTLAVVAGGYADGISKAFVGHLVLIGGHLHPIVAVCMDVALVRLNVPCDVGAEVEILGDTIDPKEVSLYETYTGLHGRCEFVYRNIEGKDENHCRQTQGPQVADPQG